MRDLVIKLWDWLSISDEPEKADCIFLFGGSSMTTPKKGLELFNKNLAPYILTTGKSGTFGNPGWDKPIADVFANYLLQHDITPEHIVIQNVSTNTKEDVTLTIPILEDKGIPHQQMIIVSRPVHQRRAYATFKKQQPNIKLINITSDEPHPSTVDEKELGEIGRRCLQEYERIIAYAIKGDIEKQIIPDGVKNAYDELKKFVS